MPTTGRTTTDPTATHPTHRTASHLRRAALSVVVALVAVLGLHVPAASAWTSPSAYASYGGVTPRGVTGVGTYYRIPGALYGSTVAALNVAGPVVTRSNATSGAQTVEYRYAVYRWSGSGYVAVYNSWTFLRTIPAGYSSTAFDPEVFRTPSIGYYRVTFSVTWKDAYGRLLGARNFDYAHAGDYGCGVVGCQVGAGWVYI